MLTTLLDLGWREHLRAGARLLSFALLFAALLPSSAQAVGIDPELPPEPTLQDLLDEVSVPPLMINADDPSGVDVFMNAGDEVVFALTFHFNPLAVYNLEFGIYDVRTPSELNVIFPAPHPDFDLLTVAFDAGAFPNGFGMYVRNEKSGATIYTQDILNPGGLNYVKTFQGFGDNQVLLRDNLGPKPFGELDFIVAFDDDAADFDFNDLFLYVWGVMEKPSVPEPTALAMLTLGVLSLALHRRRS